MKRHLSRVCTALSAFGVGVLCARLLAGSTPPWFFDYRDHLIVPLLLFTASALCFIRAFPGKPGPRRGVLYISLMLPLCGGLFAAGCFALGLAGVVSSHR